MGRTITPDGGAAGSPVKSIQKGTWIWSPVEVVDITIAAVNVAKSVVVISCKPGVNATNGYTVGGGELTTSTNLHLESTVATAAAGTIYWQVIEYV